MYQDETLACVDCGRDFIFTVGEQTFFAEKGFANKPNRCPDCRRARKAQRGGSAPFAEDRQSSSRPQREMFSATCDRCGQEARVPFHPTPGKPVYCRDCFQPRAGSHR